MMGSKSFPMDVVLITLIFLFGIATNFFPLGIKGEWEWNYESTHLDLNILVPLLFFALFILRLRKVCCQLSKNPKKTILNLLSLSLIGYCLHMSIFHLNEYGFFNLILITNHPGATGHLTAASRVTDMGKFMHNYVCHMPHLPTHSHAHPPGPIIFFWSLLHGGRNIGFLFPMITSMVKISGIDLAAFAGPLITVDTMCTGLIAGVLFPIVGSLTIFPVYLLGRELFNERAGLYAGSISLIFPSLIMFSPTMDQLYPVIAVLVVYLYTIGIKRGKLIPVLTSGILMSLGTFLSFAFLTLIPILVFETLLYRKRIRKENLNRQFWVKLPFVFGIPLFTLYISLLFLFSLDMVRVFRIAMVVNTAIYKVEFHKTYWKWVFYNLYDFFTFMGVPVTLIFLKLLFKRRFRKKIAHNLLVLPFMLTLFALDVSGITPGETARIWMFLMPFGILASSMFLNGERLETITFGVLALQFLQVMIYKICVKVIVL